MQKIVIILIKSIVLIGFGLMVSFMSRKFYIQDWYYGDQLLVRNGREIGNNCILHPSLSISEEDFDNLSRYDKKVIKKFFNCDTIKELKEQVKFGC